MNTYLSCFNLSWEFYMPQMHGYHRPSFDQFGCRYFFAHRGPQRIHREPQRNNKKKNGRAVHEDSSPKEQKELDYAYAGECTTKRKNEDLNDISSFYCFDKKYSADYK